MHVPKTGGTAIGRWLKSVYRARDYVHLDVQQIADLPPESLARHRCYHSAGHFGRDVLRMTRRDDLATFTVLREPIERCVSGYHHFRRALLLHPQTFRPGYVARMLARLPEDISDVDHDFLDTIRDTQTDVLGARRDYEGFFDDLRRRRAAEGRSALLRPHVVAHVPGTEDPRRTFARAVEWLRTMPVVGLAERFGETLQLVADFLGVPPPRIPVTANANPTRKTLHETYRSALAPDTLAQLEAINRQDLALHEIARDLFEQQWARFRSRRGRTISIGPRWRSLENRLGSRERGLEKSRNPIATSLAPGIPSSERGIAASDS